jgi:hypothetical protein
MAYFRLSHVRHDDFLKSGATMDDLWCEFEGLQDKDPEPDAPLPVLVPTVVGSLKEEQIPPQVKLESQPAAAALVDVGRSADSAVEVATKPVAPVMVMIAVEAP